jgi:hypothetical protein
LRMKNDSQNVWKFFWIRKFWPLSHYDAAVMNNSVVTFILRSIFGFAGNQSEFPFIEE